MNFKKQQWSILLLILIFTMLLTACENYTKAENNSFEDATTENEIVETLDANEEVGVELTQNKEKESITNKPFKNQGKMKVHFIDVGQGDATLIQTPNGSIILKDAGDRHMGSRVVSYLKSQGVDTIDLLIGSHPHVDHIGGMAEVIENFNVKKVSIPKVTHTTRTFENLLETIKANNLTVKSARAGVTFDLDPAVELLLVAPNSPQYSILNDYSAVLKVAYNKSSFLITGDAEQHSEMEMIRNNHDINIDVLRTGHHGSGTSSTTQFLNATSPKYAIISVGENNRYNHPGRDVLTRLNNSGAEIYRTDKHETIVFTTDGQTYDINIKQPYQYTPHKVDSADDDSEIINSSTKHIDLVEEKLGKININTASLEQLQKIVHIGETRAEEIKRLRPFTSLADLDRVSGLGPSRIKDIKEEGKAYTN